MIEGLGIDIIRVSRIKKSLESTPGFETSIFSETEIDYCRKKARPEQHFAVRFAAKEAFMKALGTGWRGGIRFQDIIVDISESGAPVLRIIDPSFSLIQDLPMKRLFVSLSHDGDYAAATVIIEKNES